ncbi:MAG: polynucleotide adenylyltransferase PcnB [Gammaproteobacteria bacterium]|nr:polynucleotide adenylyltransferase PcnB [Gammaproteobacteria bacterium]
MTVATIIPRAEHCISRDNIDDNALKVLYRLHKAGFRALLVGGGVRDLLMNHVPKDFDIATDAHPEQVKKLFSNCRLIGRRFRLAHIFFGREIVEVATFRAGYEGQTSDSLQDDAGRILRDNVYGDIEDDVWRRDFTINALYYDIADFSVVDYTGAMEDLKKQQLKLIGDPETRYREDPVRMLRAIRFAAKLGFSIHQASEKYIYELGHLLRDIPPARLYEEVLKLFHSGYALTCLGLLQKYQLFQYLFPQAGEHLEDSQFEEFIRYALESTDARVNEGKPITPAFLFAAMLWGTVTKLRDQYVEEDMPLSLAMQHAMSIAIKAQVSHTSIPRRFSMVMRDIWHLQYRFNHRNGRRAKSLLTHPKFRAAYDFMCIRNKAGELQDDSCEWWTRLQVMSSDQQEKILNPSRNSQTKKKTLKKKI